MYKTKQTVNEEYHATYLNGVRIELSTQSRHFLGLQLLFGIDNLSDKKASKGDEDQSPHWALKVHRLKC